MQESRIESLGMRCPSRHLTTACSGVDAWFPEVAIGRLVSTLDAPDRSEVPETSLIGLVIALSDSS